MPRRRFEPAAVRDSFLVTRKRNPDSIPARPRAAHARCGPLVLSIDQGTTGSRAFLFTDTGRVIYRAYRELRQYYPRPGWVEHDPDEILSSVHRVVRDAVGDRATWNKIGAIGITNQRETLVLWDARTGRPVHRAIVWQCRRSAGMCAELRGRRGMESFVRSRTGLVLDPYFSGTKIRWLLDNVPNLKKRAARGGICFGTIDSWILWNLAGKVHATDFTNASRTLLFNIRTRRWDPDLLEMLGISRGLRLPEVRNSAGMFGQTRGSPEIPDGIPISGVCGDQQAALFGQGATSAGEIKNTYGTGCFLMLHTGDRYVPPKDGLLTTLACDSSGRPAYALEGSVFVAGAAIQWLRDELRLIESSAECETLAHSVPDSGGVVVIPAFTGLGAPYWNPAVRGAVFGLTRGSSRAHLVRATLESIAFQAGEVFEVMKAVCSLARPAIRIRRLRVDGGAARNDFLMQFQADLLGIPILRPRQTETTAWGAARLAGQGAGIWGGERRAIQPAPAIVKTFHPKLRRSDVRMMIDRWNSFVRRLL